MSNLDYHTQNYIRNGLKITTSLAEDRENKHKDNLFFLAIGSVALIVILMITILNTYVFFIADVSGSSMTPTLNDGDKLLTSRYKEIEIDSIITVRQKTQNGNQLWIKRVIALGGDTVEIKDGKVFVNGKQKSEPYILEGVKTQSIKDGIDYGYESVTWVLAEDEVFFLGDNRKPNGSMDSRVVGACKRSDVVGVIVEWKLFR